MATVLVDWKPVQLFSSFSHLVMVTCYILVSIRKWGKETFDHLHALSHSPEAGLLQIFQASGYDLYKQHRPVHLHSVLL